MTAPQASKTPPRDDVCRSVPFTSTRDDGDGLTFEGYGAVFNSPTRIDSWEGTFDEQIAPGAFRKSLRERTPKFQFDHGHHSLIGSVPIGVIEDIREDDNGLFVQARLGQHFLIDLIREAIATGAIDGMSFRFSVVRDEWRDAEGKLVRPEDVEEALWSGSRGILLRTLKEVKIAEVGPVVWPAYSDTTASVRSQDPVEIDPTRLNEPEQRRKLGELLLRAEAVDAQEEGEKSDDEPQDTPDGAVEHSDEDTGTPPPTEVEAEGHEPPSDPPTDEVDETIRAAEERLFTEALAHVRTARESTPPMKGL
ncbi:phage prohead protease [Mycolicibacterium canariasense]|uniref:Phage prohead protease n=1 Tax=Mycolicibacterium canariasense TaxID=228230 RepID=A0A100WC37_MYCCR|nr:HK97 family phage prohead protease [Mycolicibacterium canariasense]MCV7212656.1 HK97 family phage prohead protease [Mycolicibacterium canariasense]ORV02509.1 primosomal replication protein N [Mycolicibacterium canariasense]GAS95471.1 phage prohead protease [Mycolicibacterium canariasense]